MDALRLLLTLSLIISASSSSSLVNGDDAPKVSFEIYYESLCPYCSNLIVNYLPELFNTDLITITDFKLVPYGNAKIRADGTVTCQHGQWECLLNTVEACAIDTWPEVKDYFPFVYCVESLVYNHNYTYWETCYEKLGLDATPVTKCIKGDQGKELILQYAGKTASLEPPHKYVPWVVVDGQPLYDDYRYFADFICKAYKGATKPSACSGSSVRGIRKVKMDLMNSLYGKVTPNSKLWQIGSAFASWLQRNNIVSSS